MSFHSDIEVHSEELCKLNVKMSTLLQALRKGCKQTFFFLTLFEERISFKTILDHGFAVYILMHFFSVQTHFRHL